jgi:hypothetical protein
MLEGVSQEAQKHVDPVDPDRNTGVKTTPPIMYILNFLGHKYT